MCIALTRFPAVEVMQAHEGNEQRKYRQTGQKVIQTYFKNLGKTRWLKTLIWTLSWQHIRGMSFERLFEMFKKCSSEHLILPKLRQLILSESA